MKTLFLLVCLAGTVTTGKPQGTIFSNLGFESGMIVPQGNGVSASAALPGWTVYLNNIQANTIFYNNTATGGWMVSLHDSPMLPISGRYSVLLQSGAGPSPGGFITGPAAIAQTGTVPVDSRSIFVSSSEVRLLDVTLLGTKLSFIEVANMGTYSIFGADVTGFGGQAGELRFTTPYPGGAFIDDIQFSPNVVPEPKTLVLLLIGGIALLRFGRLKRR